NRCPGNTDSSSIKAFRPAGAQYSERSTPPTITRVSIVAAGARVTRIFCLKFMRRLGQPGGSQFRRRRGELREVGEAETALDFADLPHGVLEAVFAELLMFDLLEPVAHLIELFCRERLLPGREDDRVFARRVGAVHPHERFQRPSERLGAARAQ